MTFILADDLTGALEVGCSFAQTGKSTAVYLNPASVTTDISVFNTNTRNASSKDIEIIFAKLIPHLQHHQGFIYKKIDSTLRGPIKLELEQLYKYGFRQFLLAPAYPKLERVTLEGYQYVKGQKVTDSPAAEDPLSPATTSYLSDLVPVKLQEKIQIASRLDKTLLYGEHSIVVNITTNDELQSVAKILFEMSYQGVIVGSNGLAEYLAQTLGIQQPPQTPVISSLLIVSGSNHPATHAQLDTLRKTGIVKATPTSNKSIVLLESPRDYANALEIQETLKQSFLEALKEHKPAALMIMGGQTAQTLLTALMVKALVPVKEMTAGVPMSIIQGGLLDGTPLITKSGGFGNTDLLLKLLQHLDLMENL